MHPELITLPGGLSIKTYGFCLMVGFLSAVWLAMRRARRVKANPDTVLDISFLALLFGVGGARLFYVVHYWPQFADAENRLFAIVDIRQGGLEFLGGLLGALFAILIYLWLKKQSIRLYLDVMVPSLMWGLAFGRLGCFFNGCCFGAVCVIEGGDQPAYPWAMQFPYHSPAQLEQWDNRQVTIPAELILTASGLLHPRLVPETDLSMSVERRERPLRDFEDLKKRYAEAQAEAPNAEETAALKAELATAEQLKQEHRRKLAFLAMAQRYPSRVEPTRTTSVSELEDLASLSCSLYVHPTQLYAAMHAILLSGFLSAVFYARKRHGVVVCLTFILYPIGRIVLEQIRVDNPRDVGGLTISQFLSVVLVLAGLASLIYLYKFLPARSPRADAATSPPKTT